MMNINSKMFQKIKDKEYRSRFIFGQIKTGVPFQLRALRTAREMTQKELGDAAKLPQTVISRIENGDGGSLSIKTLLKLADAFDVALVVRFEPIDKLMDWADNLSPEVLTPQPSEKVLAEIERQTGAPEATAIAAATPARHLSLASSTTGAYQMAFGFGAGLTSLSYAAGQTPAGQVARTNTGQTPAMTVTLQSKIS